MNQERSVSDPKQPIPLVHVESESEASILSPPFSDIEHEAKLDSRCRTSDPIPTESSSSSDSSESDSESTETASESGSPPRRYVRTEDPPIRQLACRSGANTEPVGHRSRSPRKSSSPRRHRSPRKSARASPLRQARKPRRSQARRTRSTRPRDDDSGADTDVPRLRELASLTNNPATGVDVGLEHFRYGGLPRVGPISHEDRRGIRKHCEDVVHAARQTGKDRSKLASCELALACSQKIIFRLEAQAKARSLTVSTQTERLIEATGVPSRNPSDYRRWKIPRSSGRSPRKVSTVFVHQRSSRQSSEPSASQLSSWHERVTTCTEDKPITAPFSDQRHIKGPDIDPLIYVEIRNKQAEKRNSQSKSHRGSTSPKASTAPRSSSKSSSKTKSSKSSSKRRSSSHR